VQESVYQFWAFKPSVGDAATLPVVALQIYALPAYEHWLRLLQQAGAAGIADLPRHSDDLTHGTEVRKVMRTLRRVFMNDPSLGDKIEDFLSAEYKQEINVREHRLLKNLAKLYKGRDNQYLNFYGPPGTITTIPYNAVITGNDSSIDQTALDFNDKIVFVGFSDLYDPGQPDRFYTVFSRSDGVDLSGIEIAATAAANLLTDRTLKPIDTSTTIEILLLFGGMLGAGVYLLPALMGVPFAIVLTISYVIIAQFAFNAPNVWLPLATPVLVQLPMALLIGLLGQYQLERRRQKQFSKAISYYLPKHAVKELTQTKLDPSSLNKVVYGSCLATDMSGFTTISETMAPEELAMFMNRYFETLAQALKDHKVDVTEFHADSIMCAWIAKKVGVRSRYNAAHAGLAAIDAINLFNEQAENVNLNARVGLDEGQFYLGHTGGGGRFGYSILGDCANTASRLESLNKQLGTHILATQPVVETATDLLVRPLGDFILFGKKDLTSINEIMAWKTTVNADQVSLCERFAEALDFFKQHQWAKAVDHFEAILSDYPEDGPSRFYLSRCHYYQAQPPSVEDPCLIRMLSK
jgi:adenylate cyclase